MKAQNELLDAIQVLIDKALKDRATRITGGVVKSASGGLAVVTINGYDYSFPYSGDAPKVGSTCRVFIPNGNMSDAFIGGGSGGGSTGTTNYNALTNKPSINGVSLQGNKTNADLGIVNDVSYTHDQVQPTTIWTIAHNLNKYPSVTTMDAAGNQIVGDIAYTDLDNLTVTFTSNIAGKAYLN